LPTAGVRLRDPPPGEPVNGLRLSALPSTTRTDEGGHMVAGKSKPKVKLNGGSESISISLPGWLIETIDKVCDDKDLNRSVFFKRASKKYLLELLDSPDLWGKIYHDIKEGS
jgi:hypothetical protein